MNKIKDVTLDSGLSLLSVLNEVEKDKLIDQYISKIESGEILPPQYIGTDNKLIKDKIPSKEDWIKSVKFQETIDKGVIKIDSKKFKIKKINKKGQPLKGVEFKMYANKEDALKDENVLDTQRTNENGIATFENDL